MKDWQSDVFRMRKDHKWKAKPGYKIFIADRGAVRFDVPDDWVIIPGDPTFEFRDKQPPDDDCLMQFTLMRLDPRINWKGLPLPKILQEVLEKDSRGVTSRGDPIGVRVPNLEMACTEFRFMDTTENREAISRWCLARSGLIMPLISMDLWVDDEERFGPVWNEVIRSLQVDKIIRDPLRGPD